MIGIESALAEKRNIDIEELSREERLEAQQ
jgi:hypothetical protein